MQFAPSVYPCTAVSHSSWLQRLMIASWNLPSFTLGLFSSAWAYLANAAVHLPFGSTAVVSEVVISGVVVSEVVAEEVAPSTSIPSVRSTLRPRNQRRGE